MAISINKARLIRQLQQKKYRYSSGRYIVEGKKMVEELLAAGLPVDFVVASDTWKPFKMPHGLEVCRVTETDLKKLSNLATANEVMAVTSFALPDTETIDPSVNLVLALDNVQDPGNLGTIIRLADWFGIRQIVCSPDTVDVYNPKVVQATMGSIFRTEVFYTALLPVINSCRTNYKVPSYATVLSGEDVYLADIQSNGLVVFGNESKGVSHTIANAVDKGLKILPFPPEKQHVDSLNVSVAAAIVCAEFRRRSVLSIRNGTKA